MIKKILNHRAVAVASLVSLFLVLGGFLWLLSALQAAGSGPFIINFNDIQGITRTGGMGDVVMMGILATLIVTINFFLAIELDARDRMLGKLVAGITLAGAILLFISFVAILNVN
jgi:predicted Abi (CAAX) family protease